MKPNYLAINLDRRGRRRLGAVLTLELILVLPIALVLIFGVIETSLLWSCSHRVQAAAAAGCRVATYPGATMYAVRQAIESSLDKSALVQAYQVEVAGGPRSGDEICVTVNVPQTACAPDLLRVVGFSLQGNVVTARSIMRRE